MMAAMSSAFLLFGMALLYATTGTMDFKSLAEISTPVTAASTLMLAVGVGMMIVAVGFKLGLAPFHLWAADVYEGASAPITAFIATVSKGAMLGVLLRFFVSTNLYRFDRIVEVFTMMAVLSMLAGNLLALRQNNIKRMLAYSSIAHFGYLLIAVLAAKQIGLHAATFYITAYVIAILIAFGLITLLSRSGSEASEVERYRGMLWRKPLLATLLAIALLSLAGIPLTAGFMSKFMLLTAGVASAKWLMVFSLVIGSVLGLFYYLRVIVIMMTQEQNPIMLTSLSSASSFTCIFLLTTLGVLMIWFGIYPAWIVNLITSLQLGSS
jgi:NADH-quinone oxidoreductase subunit N